MRRTGFKGCVCVCVCVYETASSGGGGGGGGGGIYVICGAVEGNLKTILTTSILIGFYNLY